jgi:hypothetical protein
MTKDKRYEILFSSVLRDGYSFQESLKTLTSAFNLKLLELERLLKRAPCSVKSCAAEKTAKQYVRKLWQAGWHSEVHRGGKVIYKTQETSRKPSTCESLSIAQKEIESLVFPNSWRELTELNPNASIQAGCKLENSYCIVIHQVRNGEVGLLAYSKAVTNTACKSLGNFYLEEFCRPVTIDRSGYRTYLSEFKSAQTDSHGSVSELYYMIGVFEGKDKFYSIYLWADASRYQEVRSTFLSIIESFDLVNKSYNQAT